MTTMPIVFSSMNLRAVSGVRQGMSTETGTWRPSISR